MRTGGARSENVGYRYSRSTRYAVTKERGLDAPTREGARRFVSCVDLVAVMRIDVRIARATTRSHRGDADYVTFAIGYVFLESFRKPVAPA